MTFVIVCGQIDLSVGSNMILTSCLTAKLLAGGAGIYEGIVFALVVGTLLGAVNGWFVTVGKLPSFLVTLGTMALYKGIAQAMTGASAINLPRNLIGLDEAMIFHLPWPDVIFIVFAVAVGLLLHKTVFGRWVFAVGTNETAAEYSGIPVNRVKVLVFALTGFMCGVGALMLASRLGEARYDLIQNVELDAITVAVVGGASISGGSGTILGSFFALMLIDLMKREMGVAGVKAEYQLTAIGVLLIAAVFVMRLGEGRMAGRTKRRAPKEYTAPG
jgi:rhamnose transport system permease protein